MKVELWVAIYGAVTGTIAIASTIRQWWLDRAILQVKANIAIVNTDRLRVMLSISAVNNGRRPVSIKHVGALLDRTSVPIPLGLSPERSAEVSKAMQIASVSSECTLYGGRGEKPIEIGPDGGQRTWNMQLVKGPQFLSHTKGSEELGTAYVELTSGKKVFCDFLILKDEHWPNA